MEATTKQQVKKANHSAKFKVEVNLKPSPIAISSAERARKQWHLNYKWDSVSLGTSSTSTRELLANTKYMVVDVETHDWKEQTSHSNGQIRGRIVEIAWKTFDAKGNCLDSKQYLLKPHGYNEITKKATSVHGITTKCAINHGSDAKSVFDEFTSILKLIPKDGFVVAYRMLDEDSIIMCNLSQEQKVVWDMLLSVMRLPRHFGHICHQKQVKSIRNGTLGGRNLASNMLSCTVSSVQLPIIVMTLCIWPMLMWT